MAVHWYTFVLIVVLILLSAFFSGLNLGLMGLDTKYLELLMIGPFETKEDERAAKFAKKILPIRKRGNLLLCTILLGNVAVNTALSILMADLTSGLIGLVVSTLIIVIIGEIVPQAICNRYALPIGARVTWMLWFCIGLFFIIAYPISVFLNKVLGEEEGNVYSKVQMKKLFQMYEKEKLLNPSERKILTAALEMHDKNAESIMQPLDKTFMLDIDSKITKELLRTIYKEGFSRIPIFEQERSNIVGILMTRELILINPEKADITIRQLQSILIRNVVQIDCKTLLEPILSYFKRGHSHMGIVTQIIQHDDKDPEIRKIGIVTLEDIIEELLQEEIEDEKFNKANRTQRKQLKEKLVLLFNEDKKGQPASEEEIFAISEFLQKQVKAFRLGVMKRSILLNLIKKSQVVEIENKNNQINVVHETITGNIRESPTKASDIKFDSQESIKVTKILQSQTNLSTDNLKSQKIVLDDININVPNAQDSDSQSNYGSILPVPIINTTHSPQLYRKDLPSEDFFLILQGKVLINSGQEGFMIEQGPFSYLGVDALLIGSGNGQAPNQVYRPDFSAKVIKYARLLKITKADYLQALKDVNADKRKVNLISNDKPADK